MALRSGTQGYGWVTKTLHWLVFAAIAAQFLVGYSLGRIDVPERDCDPPGESLSGGETTAAEEEQLDRTEDRCEAAADRAEERADDPVGTAWDDLTSGTLGDGGIGLGEAHVLLGLLILTLAVVRVAWRRHDGLPPWSEHLSDGDRRLVHWTERVLLTLLFVVPLSGLLLVATGEENALRLHITAHIAFFVSLAAHLFTNLRPRILTRML